MSNVRIRSANETTAFSYDANRSRYKRTDTKSGVTITTYYAGNVEVVSQSDSNVITFRRNLPGAIALYRDNGTSEVSYLHTDHLGSLDTITNEEGLIKQKLYFDAWGKKSILVPNMMLDVLQLASTQLTLANVLYVTLRGFTGHEGGDHADIIHMNGRIYDPTLGRFLQADPHIQAPKNSQSYNRYSYVLNNPLSYTDPSGYFFNKLFKKLNKALGDFAPFVAIAIGVLAGPWAAQGFWNAALVGFASGGVATGSLKGALIGAFSAGVFQQIGAHYKGLGAANELNKAKGLTEFGSNMLTSGQIAGQIASHAVAGGVISTLSGGKFGHGFFSAGFTKAAGGAILPGGSELTDSEIFGGAIASAVIGGTVSTISGGKFGNGAQTGAFQFLFNQASPSLREKIVDIFGKRSWISNTQLAKAVIETKKKIETLSLEEIGEINRRFVTMSGRDVKTARFLLEQDFQQNVARPVTVQIGRSMTFQAIADLYISPGMSRFTPMQQLFIGEMISAAGPQNAFNVNKVNEFLNQKSGGG